MIHVPRAWEEKVRSWVGNYRESKELMGRISEALLERFLKEKERASRPRAMARRTFALTARCPKGRRVRR
jgi:hypothetical protein